MRPIGGPSTRWAERLQRPPDDREAAVDAAIARAALAIDDGVDPSPSVDAGGDAVATVGGRGRAGARAVALFRALAEARDELAPVELAFGAFTEALEGARDQVEGELAGLLERYVDLRRRIAAGAGSIASG